MAKHSCEIHADEGTTEVTFSANGKYIISGHSEGIQVWRVEDGKQIASMFTGGSVKCLAVSDDERYTAVGFGRGVIVADASTYGHICTLSEAHSQVNAVDFSPDSTRLVTGLSNRSVFVWDVANVKRVLGPLRHDYWVRAAKYSSKGDRIATGTAKSVRVWDSYNGRLLLDIQTEATPSCNRGLLWSGNHLLVLSNSKIKQFEASIGSLTSEWQVSDTTVFSCITLSQYGTFIACSGKDTVTFWDTSGHVELGAIQHTRRVHSIAFSPDTRFLATVREGGEITISYLPNVIALSLPRLHTFEEPVIHVDATILAFWEQGQLPNSDALIAGSDTSHHHVLASRSLFRTRLGQLDAAIDDANQSVKLEPSVIGYIARSVALVAKGDKLGGYRSCDIAFAHSHLAQVNLLLLIKAIIVFVAGEHDDALSRLDDLIATVPMKICYVVQAYIYLLLGNSRMESGDYKDAVQLFKRARTQVRPHETCPLSLISLITGWKFDDLGITIRQRLCEASYAAGSMEDGSKSFVEMLDAFGVQIYTKPRVVKWVSQFTSQRLSDSGDDSNTTHEMNEWSDSRAGHGVPNSLNNTRFLEEWAKSTLFASSWKDALNTAYNFIFPRFTVYRAICEYLELTNQLIDACGCLRQMLADKLVHQSGARDEQTAWVISFKQRCSTRLEDLGDAAMAAERSDEAVSMYSTLLSLDSSVPQDVFIKRSKAYLACGSWKDALDDAEKVIAINPLSPWGYERKHAALHAAGDYENAIGTLETMHSKLSESPDAGIREHLQRYMDPRETRTTIHDIIEDAIREFPPMLINTNSGRLCDRFEQAAAFESLPVFAELISSMSTHIDHLRIEQEVGNYYRYATLSHKWEGIEPLFEKVIHIVVYDLEASITHDKLQMFCKIARKAGVHWAWSDTCCINKADVQVLQEALVLMFKWYEGSAVTIVLLRDVHPPSQRGELARSIWNSRAWTLQEYHASKVVRFYNEDWTPYLDLDIPNHKESPEIISEMEEATGVSARVLTALRPGLDDIRDKLRLASARQTTRLEDAAYSLFGIFSTSLPVVYGDGEKALGKLLAQLLTSSGDTSILAWTGRRGNFNSCLPARISVFNHSPSSHIPLPIKDAAMGEAMSELRASSLKLSSVMKLYHQLNKPGLRVAHFTGQRLKLPCITFPLGPVVRGASGRSFRAKTDALGIVDIETTEDLTQCGSLTLIHPWIDFLLDRRPVGGVETRLDAMSDDHSTGPSNVRRRLAVLFGRPFGARPTEPYDSEPLLSPPPVSPAKNQSHALQIIARLRQPFGALLFAQTRTNVHEYKRVATESLVTVQVEEITSATLDKLVDSVEVLDVL